MIIRSVGDTIGTERDVHGPGWKSRRIVLSGEGPDYSLHETTLDAGLRLAFTYARHRETVYVVAGEGTIEDVAGGRTVALAPGSLYSAGIGEEHVISTKTEMRLVCVFTPPLQGAEEAD